MVHSAHLPPSLPPASLLAAFHSPWRGGTKGNSTFQECSVCIRPKCVFDWTITFCADSDSSIGPRRGVDGVLRFSFTSCSVRPCQMKDSWNNTRFVCLAAWSGVWNIRTAAKCLHLSTAGEHLPHSFCPFPHSVGTWRAPFSWQKLPLVPGFWFWTLSWASEQIKGVFKELC